jgi:hypothetical protein
MSLELGHMNPGIDFERLKRNREREREREIEITARNMIIFHMQIDKSS